MKLHFLDSIQLAEFYIFLGFLLFRPNKSDNQVLTIVR